MDNKIIYVNFKKASKKSKRYPKNNNIKYKSTEKHYFRKIINKIKSLFMHSDKKNYKNKDIMTYKHWL